MDILPPQCLFDRIHAAHGHYCPMSTLGGRIGFAARRRFSGGLRAAYLHRTCAVDGVSVATGCQETDGSLQVFDRGRHALVVVEEAFANQALEISLLPQALDLAWQYRRMDEALVRERNQLSAAETAKRIQDKDLFLANLLTKLRTLPEAKLLTFCEVIVSPESYA